MRTGYSWILVLTVFISTPSFSRTGVATFAAEGEWMLQGYLDWELASYNHASNICTEYTSGNDCGELPPDGLCGPVGLVCNVTDCHGTGTGEALPSDHCDCGDGTASVTKNGNESCPGTPMRDENPDQCTGGGAQSNPIITRNGNKYLEETDYIEHAEYPLVLKRYYYYQSASQTATWIFAGMPMLTMEVDTGVEGTDPEENLVRRFMLYEPDGSTYEFLGNNVNGYQAVIKDEGSTLSVWSVSGTQQGWIITDRDGAVRNFNMGSASGGVTTSQLVSETQANGLGHSLSYSSNQVTETNNVTGTSIQWNYSGSNVSSAVVSGVGTFHYGYIGSMLQTATDPAGGVRTYWYENGSFPQALTGVSDENNVRYKTYGYDTHGRATYTGLGSATSAGPESATIIYSGWPTWTSATVTNAAGENAVYTFSPLKGSAASKVSATQGSAAGSCMASNTGYTYDANGYRNSETDGNGTVNFTKQDSMGRVSILYKGGVWSTSTGYNAWTPQAYSQRVDTTYNGNTSLPTQKKYQSYSSGSWTLYRTEGFSYDGNNRIKSRTVTDNINNTSRTWTYNNTYYSGSAVLKSVVITDPLSHTTTSNYNNSGQLTSMVNAASQTTTYSDFNALGQPQTITDPNNVVTKLTYDTLGNLKTATRDYGGVNALTNYDYYPNHLLHKVTSPDNSYIQYTYNSAHQLTNITNSHGEHTDFTPSALDGQWSVASTYSSSGTSTLVTQYVREFDALGRVSKIKDAYGPVKNIFGYDMDNNVTTQTQVGDHGSITLATYDNHDIATVNQYDSLNRIKTSIGGFDCGSSCALDSYNNYSGTVPSSPETQYDYDDQGNIKTITDANGLVTNYTYNGFGELTQQVSPDSGTTTYHYDAAGRMDYKTDARNTTTNYQYDALNRLTAIYFGSTPGSDSKDIIFTYDQNDSSHGYGKGHLTNVVDNSSGMTNYEFDSLGNILTKTLAPISTTLSLVTQYGYNAAGAVTQVTYPGGRVVTYDRTSDRLNDMVINYAGSQSLSIDNVAYQPFGSINQFVRHFETGNTITNTQQLYANGGLYSRTFDINDSGSYAFTYGQDAYGNISTISDGLNPNAGQSFEYDPLQRLTKATGDYGRYTYNYDATGNRYYVKLEHVSNIGDVTHGYDPTNPSTWVWSEAYHENYLYVGQLASHTDPKTNNRLKSAQRKDGSNLLLRNRTFDFGGNGNRIHDRKIVYESDGVTKHTDTIDVLSYSKTNRMSGAVITDCKAHPTASACQ